jgi:glycosyltransferase involved in cell wall biosynthesis
VIVPAYNEEARLGATLERIAAHLEARGAGDEIVVVDDGSTDRTAAAAEAVGRRVPVPLRVLRNPTNLGKGASVRAGVEAATRPVILFSDADLSTPIEELDRLLAVLEESYDVAIGSRAAEGARIEVRQAWYREYLGKAFNLLVRLLTGLPFRDTQCGFKAFRSEAARSVYRDLRVRRFGFDVEVLFLARRRGQRIREVPVVWRNSPSSRVNPLVDGARMAWDVLLIRLRALTGAYDRPADGPRGRVLE